MVRFLHTADWQLGMTRRFLAPEAQARFAQARLDAVRALGELAGRERCAFAVVCGDVFETNQVARLTVARALEALAGFPVQVYLVPGNHDPLDAASVYRSSAFAAGRPGRVTVLADASPVEAAPGVDLVGAPWMSKRPLADLCASAAAALEPRSERLRVLAGHGAVDVLSPDPELPGVIRLAALEQALSEGRIAYVALGDRHSTTSVGATGRVWYAGAPEATDYGEQDPGNALVVDCDGARVEVTKHRVGSWRFLRQRFDLNGGADVAVLADWLAAVGDKPTAVVKLDLVGALSLADKDRLDERLEHFRDLFAAIEVSERASDLAVVAGDADFADLEVSGFARAALDDLRARASAGGAEAATARDALGLLLRLARRRA